MNTKTTGLAIRAIASTMVEKYLFRYSLIIESFLFVSWLVSAVLTFIHDPLWLILATILLPFIIFFGLITVISYFVFSRLRPRKLSNKESKQITVFVSEFGIKAVAAKGVKKSPVALSGLIAWKYIKGRGKRPMSTLLLEPINDISSLKTKFLDIVKLFN